MTNKKYGNLQNKIPTFGQHVFNNINKYFPNSISFFCTYKKLNEDKIQLMNTFLFDKNDKLYKTIPKRWILYLNNKHIKNPQDVKEYGFLEYQKFTHDIYFRCWINGDENNLLLNNEVNTNQSIY
jgi:hypothetical protein